MGRNVALAVVITFVSALPVMLFGALSVLIQQDLGLGEAQLGATIAAYFAAGAVTAGPAGWLADRLSPRRVVWGGLALVTCSLLGIGMFAETWMILIGLMALGGLGGAASQLATNVLVARGVAQDRQGIAFGLKQAGTPLAALLAGLSVPAVGVVFGWQSIFILGAVIAPMVAATVPRGDRLPEGRQSRQGSIPAPALIALAVGLAMASAGGTSTAGFIVASAVNRGMSAGDAGLVLAGGSLVGIATRVFVGWLTDRLGRWSLVLLAILLGFGSIGYVGLAISADPIFITASGALAFGGGWGWAGLWLVAISRAMPASPGGAMGVGFVGGMTGAVLGPFTFGWLAEHAGFSVAWLAMAALALVGIGAVLLSRTILTARVRLGPEPL